MSGSGGFRGVFGGGLRGIRGGRGGGFGGHGGYARGGYTAAGLSFSHEKLHQDYPSPDPQTGAGGGYPTGYEGGYPGPGAGGYPGGGYGAGAYEVEPSRQIMVRKVSPVLASL